MVKKLGDRVVSVTANELGPNCWLTKRFIQGERCERLYRCHYPERKTCQAVHTEVAYLKEHQRQLIKQSGDIDVKVEEVIKMLKK